MLRLRNLVALLVASAGLAGFEFFPSSSGCVASAIETPRSADVPWHADLHIDSMDGPTLAAVPIAVTGSTEAGGFAEDNDISEPVANACTTASPTPLVAASAVLSPHRP